MSVVPRSVVITGANRGIGLELVRQLLTLTPTPVVIATARDPSKATQLQQLATTHPNHVHVLQLEVTEYTSFPSFVKQVQSLLKETTSGALDLLINNAGITFRRDLDSVTVEELLHTYEVNTVAPLVFTRALLPSLKLATQSVQRALIANMSSILGSIALTDGSSYSYRASKAAMNMVTRTLSIDLQADKIQVVSLHPGWVQTDMGGPNAIITPHTSVSGMLTKVILNADLELNGKFYSYDGSRLEW